VNQRVVGDFEREWRKQLGLLRHFLAQQSDQIEGGRASGLTPPPGELGVGFTSLGTEGLEGSQQQSAVSGDSQDWLFGHRVRIPQLRLANTQGVLFFPVIYLDLPAIKVDLQ
jgi:hypothetical protein